jgi:hypothetical protein
MERAHIERDLDAVSAHLARARDELALVTDQLSALSEEADSARLRALVAETPQSHAPFERAQKHVETLVRARNTVQETITELEDVRDDLLAQLLASQN